MLAKLNPIIQRFMSYALILKPSCALNGFSTLSRFLKEGLNNEATTWVFDERETK